MAVPRNRHSTSRKNTRRAHDALKAKHASHCPNCGAAKLSHRACGGCGFYKGRMVIETGREEA